MMAIDARTPPPTCIPVTATRATGATATTAAVAKHSLGFILNDVPAATRTLRAPTRRSARSIATSQQKTSTTSTVATRAALATRQPTVRCKLAAGTKALASSRLDDATATAVKAHEEAAAHATAKAKAAPKTYEQKRLARKCTVDDCMNYTINRGLCFRHGGGKKCTFENCNASAKIAGLCWKHGGSIPCVVDGCDRRGKSRGLCWAHGGGTKCQAETCTKVAISNGLCWAHGGGKRCQSDGCQRPAYERTLNFCPKHFRRFEAGEEVLEL